MRLVLVNVPKPESIVRELVSLVRPGGWVASCEADLAAIPLDPPSPEWDRLFAAYRALAESQSIDLFVGRRTHRMFREAGLTDIDVEVSVRVHPLGHSRRPIYRDFINNVRDKLIDGGFISRDELEQNLRAYERHLADPDVLATSSPYFLVRGRVPTGW